MSNQQHAVGWVERSETHQAHAGIDGFRSSTHPTWLESPQLRRYSSLNTPAKPMPTDVGTLKSRGFFVSGHFPFVALAGSHAILITKTPLTLLNDAHQEGLFFCAKDLNWADFSTTIQDNTPAKPMPTMVGKLKSRGFFIAWIQA